MTFSILSHLAIWLFGVICGIALLIVAAQVLDPSAPGDALAKKRHND
jgi:hypothetical protein